VVPLLAVPAVAAWGWDAGQNHPSIGTWLHIPGLVWKIVIGVGIAGIAYSLGQVTVVAWERLEKGYVEEAKRERARLVRDPHQQTELAKSKWNSMGAVMVVSLLFAVANVPTWAFVASSFALGDAIVCPDSGLPVRGHLIGEGGNRTYLAAYGDHRIVSFPEDQVVRVVVGHDRTKLGSWAPTRASASVGEEQRNLPRACPSAEAPADKTARTVGIQLRAPVIRVRPPVIRLRVRDDDR